MALTSASRVTCLAPATLPTTYVWRLSLNQVGSNWSTSQNVVWGCDLQRTTTPPAWMINIIIHQQWASEGHPTHGHPRVDTGNATCLASVLAVPQRGGEVAPMDRLPAEASNLLLGQLVGFTRPKNTYHPPEKRPSQTTASLPDSRLVGEYRGELVILAGGGFL